MLKELSIRARLVIVMALLGVLLAAVGILGLYGMQSGNESMRRLVDEEVRDLTAINDIQVRLLRNRGLLAEAIVEPTLIREHGAKVDANIAENTSQWAAYQRIQRSPKQQRLAERFQDAHGKYVAEVLRPMLAALRINDLKQAGTLAAISGTRYVPVHDSIMAIEKMENDILAQQYQHALGTFSTIRAITIGAIALGLALALWMGRSLLAAIIKPLLRSIAVCESMAGGKFDNLVESHRNDELGRMMTALGNMQTLVGQQQKQTLRIKMALDCTSTSAMIADADGTIIYMNQSQTALMAEAEGDIRKELPQFRAAEIIGGSFDRFHKNASHQRNLLASLQSVHKVDINVGGRVFNLTATPIVDPQGQRSGTVVEWKDRAGELAAEHDARANARIRQALDKCSTGVMIADIEGAVIYLNDAVAAMMKEAEADLRKDLPQFRADLILGSNLDSFHKNPAHQRALLADLRGTDRSELVLGGRTMQLTASPVLNARSERLGTVVEWRDRTGEVLVEREIAGVVDGAAAGNFSHRIDPNGKEDFFAIMAAGMNRLMDTSETGLNEVLRMLKALSSGDLTQRISADYDGTFGQLKEYANSTSDQLTNIITDVRNAADALTSASEQVSSTAQSLSQAASEQASGVERTSSSVEQLSSSVAQNTENAKVTDSMAQKSSREAVEGGDAVTRTAEAMRQIAAKVGIIDDIADQTNLLALNAAIEAARAGASGKGFAVVAAEVRKLAERSQVASKEIGELAGTSVTMSERAGRLLDEMIPSIRKTSDLVQEIAAASEEQTGGLSHISKAMGQLNQVTQQNAAASEQLAATSEEMSGQAGALQQLMSFFTISQQARERPELEPVRKVGNVRQVVGSGRKITAGQLIDESQFKRF
ncbi:MULTISPECIES: methyl-accepting chemotaxis protein [unclassified Janthinobacterium]|uniref:methyl-accepting chemotaxis protein n=1 Tax=unclassified Janthinobacterium TaxID=2610881 RepID=UPI0018C9A51C|nr:methyl-accepting chemotaxis protein [Janthinobacterium sp. CG_23.4]